MKDTHNDGVSQGDAPQNPALPVLNADFSKPLPNLEDAEVAPIDLMADYWTPENPGESKRMFFDRIDMRMVRVMNGGNEELIELESAFFIEPVNGTVRSVSNASKRLVGTLQANNIKQGAALLVTFLGKKANSTNSFKSDNWSVKPLIIRKPNE